VSSKDSLGRTIVDIQHLRSILDGHVSIDNQLQKLIPDIFRNFSVFFVGEGGSSGWDRGEDDLHEFVVCKCIVGWGMMYLGFECYDAKL